MIGLKRETEGAKIFQLIEKERKSQREREREREKVFERMLSNAFIRTAVGHFIH